jgi:receptor expression-enhancing protein 5/6
MQQFEKFLENCGLSNFDDVKPLRDLSAKAGVKPSVLLGGIMTFVVVMVALNFGACILTSSIGFLYPAYMSFKAIETKAGEDDTQWLTFWVVYAVCTIFDPLINAVFYFLPFYYLFKLAFYIYLFHPKSMGARTIYNLGIKNFLMKVEAQIENVEKELMGKRED